MGVGQWIRVRDKVVALWGELTAGLRVRLRADVGFGVEATEVGLGVEALVGRI
jgi:hypothetical protein